MKKLFRFLMNAVIYVVVITAASMIASSLLNAVDNISIPKSLTGIFHRESQSPFERFDKKVEEKAESFTFYKSEWDDSICSWDDAISAIGDALSEDPFKFYVDGRKISYVERGTKDVVNSREITIPYFQELMDDSAKQRLESAAKQILDQVPANASDWKKALIVHDALVRHVTYQEGRYDQTAYGALVEGRAVCNGYAMAFEYLMTKLGIPCDTVVGFTSPVSASLAKNIIFASSISAHAWNVVTLKDEAGNPHRCFIDVTWDDPNTQDRYGEDYVLHDWFGVSLDCILSEGRGGFPEFYRVESMVTDDTMSYHRRTNSIVYSAEMEEIGCVMREQYLKGANVLTVRFTNSSDFIGALVRLDTEERDKLFDILGVDSFAYTCSNYSSDGKGTQCLNVYLNSPN